MDGDLLRSLPLLAQQRVLMTGTTPVVLPPTPVNLLFPAHLTEQASPNLQDAYSTASEPSGARSLTAIYPGGKRLALQVDQNQASK